MQIADTKDEGNKDEKENHKIKYLLCFIKKNHFFDIFKQDQYRKALGFGIT